VSADTTGMGEERCRHDMLPGTCADCRPTGRFPARVVVTSGGSAFHRSADCALLKEGQRMARRYGQETHDPATVPLAVARQQGRGECSECFPQ
jgi:hypothetical protein